MSNENEEFNWEMYRPFYAEIFSQLVANPQFNTFFATHYNLDIDIDDKEKHIAVGVNPISVEETGQRMAIIRAEQEKDSPKIFTPEIFKG